MLRRSAARRFAPWVPPPRGDTRVTAAPLPSVEHGLRGGTAFGYSDRIAQTPHWKRMAQSTFELRMTEHATTYPMSQINPGEYDTRYLPLPYRDPMTHKPVTIVGAPGRICMPEIPVIFLADVDDAETKERIGTKHETRYVSSEDMRVMFAPMRLAVYATPENYRLLGLPERDHHIHGEIARTPEELEKLRAKQRWDEEPWRFSFEFLFRRYAAGPPELDDAEPIEYDPAEAEVAAASTSTAGAGGVKKAGTKRKAKKVKLF